MMLFWRKKQKAPPLQPITYGIHVFMREAGERLLFLEQRQRAFEERMLALEKQINEMDNGQGHAVVTAKMEFETLVEAWKTGLQTQINRHEEIITDMAGVIDQIVNEE